jgi:membrane fusion protein (multidrug efflux system)
LMVPPSVLVQEGDNSFVWQLADSKLKKVKVTLGGRDPRWGTVELLSGINSGDQILRHPQGSLVEGAAVKLDQAVTATPAAKIPAAVAVTGN